MAFYAKAGDARHARHDPARGPGSLEERDCKGVGRKGLYARVWVQGVLWRGLCGKGLGGEGFAEGAVLKGVVFGMVWAERAGWKGLCGNGPC